MSGEKTNAMRILDQAKIDYHTHTYDPKDGKIDGIAVAEKIGRPAHIVFKTLVTQANSRDYYVFIIPVDKELNLKAAAKAAGEKSISMIKVNDLIKVTGYIRGGCSPLGMKKSYHTVIDSSCLLLNSMIISAGKIGAQIEITPKALIELLGCSTAELCQ